MEEEKYNMKWHTYPEHLKVMMQEMMCSNEFTDVTLVSDDMKPLKAHRNILSACSPVFETILKMQCQNNQPTIFLRGVKHAEVEKILNFIYSGEAKIYVTRMEEFLSAAKDLQIKGLITNFELETNSEPDNQAQFIGVEDQRVVREIKENHEVESNEESNDTEQLITRITDLTSNVDSREEFQSTLDQIEKEKKSMTEFKNESLYQHLLKSTNLKIRELTAEEPLVEEAATDFQFTKDQSRARITEIDEDSSTNTEEVEKPMAESQSSNSDQEQTPYHNISRFSSINDINIKCRFCDQQFYTNVALGDHIKNYHGGLKFSCMDCEYEATQSANLKRHIRNVHEGIKHQCKLCDHEFTQKNSLTRHVQTMHNGSWKYECNQCHFKADIPSTLRNHTLTKHEGIECRRYACNECPYLTNSARDFQRHVDCKHNGKKHQKLNAYKIKNL